jgi:hypothetical protein
VEHAPDGESLLPARRTSDMPLLAISPSLPRPRRREMGQCRVSGMPGEGRSGLLAPKHAAADGRCLLSFREPKYRSGVHSRGSPAWLFSLYPTKEYQIMYTSSSVAAQRGLRRNITFNRSDQANMVMTARAAVAFLFVRSRLPRSYMHARSRASGIRRRGDGRVVYVDGWDGRVG